MIVLVFLVSSESIAQVCDTNTVDSHFNTFVDKKNGTIVDENLKLQWMKCNYGERYEQGSCSGASEKLPMHIAQSKAKNYKLADENNWRLPTLVELSSLTKKGCMLPSTDIELFPTFNSEMYWTSDRFQFFSWTVSFDHGFPVAAQMGYPKNVRYVRSID